MKPSDDEAVARALARMCQFQNEAPRTEETVLAGAECRSEIDRWRRNLARPDQGLQINAKNCMRTKAGG
jgi:hypothetical protein